MMVREIEIKDIPRLFEIRISTHENRFSMADLAEAGITPQSVAAWLAGSVRGWLCEADGFPVGFALGDSASGEILVIAIRPGYEQRGIGRQLMARLEDWLFSVGHEALWLWSNPSDRVRAHGFYRHLGWRPSGEVKYNNERLQLVREPS